MRKFKIPLHDHIVDLGGGRTAGPGDFVTLTDEEASTPQIKSLLDEGHLFEAEEVKKTGKTKEEGS